MRRYVSWLLVVLLSTTALAGCSDNADKPEDKTGQTSGDTFEPTDADTGPEETGIPDASDTDIDDTGIVQTDVDTGSDDTALMDDVDVDTADVGEDTDTGPSCSVDSDSDGLSDCEEAQLCSDPHDGDTDGDHLGDFEEVQRYQSDPCSADTDNDGADDNVEAKFDLDPNRVSTYGDGTKDGDRWIISACDNPGAEDVEFYENNAGNWSLALPPAFSNYKSLSITNPTSSSDAIAVFDDTSNEVGAFILTTEAPAGQTTPLDPLKGTVDSTIRSLGSLDFNLLGSAFTTHDDKQAASVDYEMTTSQPTSVRQLRQQLLTGLAPVPKADIQGLPTTAGRTHTQFRVEITVLRRLHAGNKVTNLYTAAIAPLQGYKSSDRVKFLVDDLTNTTNVSDAVDGHAVACRTDKPGKEAPKAEFYWVLDESGSMIDENNIIRSFAGDLEKEVRNTRLDYRFGVTNVDPRNKGRLGPSPAWFSSGQTLSQQIQNLVTDCYSAGGGWNCTALEKGLESAGLGLSYMLGLTPQAPTPAERIRSNARVMTIFMSDEGAQGNTTTAANLFANNPNLYAYAIIAENPKGNCDFGPSRPTGIYKQVALSSGGGFADLCSGNLRQTLQEIVRKAAGASSEFTLGRTPISSSLRVYLNGTWVPRSTENGFDYFPEQNAIAFYGDKRPTYKQSGKPDWVAISFETWVDRCKSVGQGIDTCEPAN